MPTAMPNQSSFDRIMSSLVEIKAMLRNHQISKVEFPRFDGRNVREWLYKCEQLFSQNSILPESKVRLVSRYLDGLAPQWHLNYMRLRYDIYPYWHEYTFAVIQPFGNAREEPWHSSVQEEPRRSKQVYSTQNRNLTRASGIDFSRLGGSNVYAGKHEEENQSLNMGLSTTNPPTGPAKTSLPTDSSSLSFNLLMSSDDDTEKSQVVDDDVADPASDHPFFAPTKISETHSHKLQSEGNKFAAVADSVSVVVDQFKTPTPEVSEDLTLPHILLDRSTLISACFEIHSSPPLLVSVPTSSYHQQSPPTRTPSSNPPDGVVVLVPPRNICPSAIDDSSRKTTPGEFNSLTAAVDSLLRSGKFDHEVTTCVNSVDTSTLFSIFYSAINDPVTTTKGLATIQYPDMYSFTMLLNALQVLDQMSKCHKHAWKTTIIGCTGNRHGDVVCDFFKDLQQLEVKPGISLACCVCYNHIKEAWSSSLIETINAIAATLASQEVFIKAVGELASSHKAILDEALPKINELQNHILCSPAVFNYSLLFKIRLAAFKFELVEFLYEEMAQRSLMPNIVNQNIILICYGKAHMFDQMEKVMPSVLQRTNCKPADWTMNSITYVLGNRGLMEIMEKWYYERFNKLGTVPDIALYQLLDEIAQNLTNWMEQKQSELGKGHFVHYMPSWPGDKAAHNLIDLHIPKQCLSILVEWVTKPIRVATTLEMDAPHLSVAGQGLHWKASSHLYLISSQAITLYQSFNMVIMRLLCIGK